MAEAAAKQQEYSNIEEIKTKYIVPLYAIFKDVAQPADVRVSAYNKVRRLVDNIDNLKKSPDNYAIIRASAIFNERGPVDFDDHEKKVLEALSENPNIEIDEMDTIFEGGRRKRSMRKRSMRKRSMRKRSVKRSNMKRSTKRNMKRSTKRSVMKRRSNVTKSGSRTYSTNCIVGTLTDMLHVVKLHHWRTHDYSVHKATDNLHEALSEQVDSFVEKLLGSKHTRSNLTDLRMRSYNTLPALKQRVEYYKRYLRDMPASLGTDLLNIRDELLGSLNQFSYMLSLH